ncbi:hypothetical protein GA0061099_1008128 [Bradyrhizobium yuanmingense]|uniref:Uncharacterized protein n=1 Tax=Bradyrhizobium yuanmingense TaxID=108015 RepID=A0A1C3WZF8_9BRAD|nr:hypothetical protein IQ15_06117 [Bradyrhizobium yuanmingense]SCB45369.1 hypothetical protein GA0061099_1008128 [Bradyrhizobium yuanmingense]
MCRRQLWRLAVACLSLLATDPALAQDTIRLARIACNHYLYERHRDLVPEVGKVIARMQASGELGSLREALVKQVLSGQ